MRFIKKHKYKLLTLMLSIVSIFTLFIGINKTYAYETDTFSYTISSITTTSSIINITNNNNVYTINNNDVNNYITDLRLNLITSNTTENNITLLINYDLLVSNDNITFTRKTINTTAINSNSCKLSYNFISNDTYSMGKDAYLNNTNAFFITDKNYFSNSIMLNKVNATDISFNAISLSMGYAVFNSASYWKLIIYNVDIVDQTQIGLSQYYETYYSQIEDNYNALLSDYNTLQDNYDILNSDYNTLLTSFNTLQTNYNNMQLAYNALESDYDTLQANYRILNNNYTDLQTTYTQLQSTYNTLEQNYNDLLESFNDLNSSIDSNIISTLIGDNYFVKTNYQFTNTNSSTESYSNSINNYRWGYVTGTNLNGNTFNIGNALLESLSFVPMYTTSFNDSNFSYLDFSMYYNTPLVLEHYTATGIGSLNTQDNYAWSNGSLISCKYINIEISSSIDLLIQYRVLNQDGTNDTFIVSRDSTSQKYIISFENDDNRVLTNLRIQCKYINNNWVTADSVVCNISNVGDDNYTLGYQNGYNVGISENATNNEVNNKKITELTSRINSLNRTITSLQEQITSFNSDYNLNNLMWTIASTPFESFKQIWNVEFFGVNIASIVTGFLTGIIAIWILKKFFL